MEWIAREALGLGCPVVSGDETREVLSELIVALVVEPPDGRLLNGTVHPLDLTIGPRMLRLCGAMLDVVLGASVFEGMGLEALAICDGLLDQRHGGAAGAGCSELDTVVGEHGVDLVGDGRDQA